MTLANISLEVFCLLLMLIMLLFSIQHSGKGRIDRMFCLLLVANMLTIISDAFYYAFEGTDHFGILYAANYGSFGLGFILSIVYVKYVEAYISQKAEMPRWQTAVPITLAVIALVLLVVQAFNHMYFYIDENGYYQRGPLLLMDSCFVLAIALTAMFMVIINRKNLEKGDLQAFLSYCILPFIATLIQLVWPQMTFILLATTLSIFLIYSMIQIEYIRKLKAAEFDLAQARFGIAMSQIQPHFMYNALASIAQLCTIDPKMAQKATVNFSNYIRGNLDSVNKSEPIPFSSEIKHLNHYLSIEKLRFEERLNVEFNLETDNFLIPALSVQPLVENAIRHGICKKPEGGTVKIASREEKDCFVVIVTDDGVGFNKTDAPDGNGTHIGMENVKQRLEAMVGGSFEIESEVGVGTTAKITIPKR